MRKYQFFLSPWSLISLSLHRWSFFITHQASRFFVILSFSPSLSIHPHPSPQLFHTKHLSSPLSLSLSLLFKPRFSRVLIWLWVKIKIKIKISQTHNKKWIATVASKWILCSCGANTFGIYSSILKSSQGYDNQRSMAFFKDFGSNDGFLMFGTR